MARLVCIPTPLAPRHSGRALGRFTRMGLQLVEIIMAAEREFSVEIPDTAVASVRRVGDLHAVVVAALGTRSAGLSSEAVWFRLRDIVAEYLGLSPESVTPDADF